MRDMRKVIVRAIDSGFGYMKFTKAVHAMNDVTFDKFPSVALKKAGSAASLVDNDTLSKTVDVTVNGEVYTVGHEAHLDAPTNSDPRILHEDYLDRPEYLALHYGALYYMDVEHIDFLVVGLPVELVGSRKQDLIELLQGEHQITQSRKVTIDNVVVMPQPLGALMAYALKQGPEVYQQIKQETTLIPDPGYKTFDWVLVSGLRPIASRSGTHAGAGMRDVLNIIVEDMQSRSVTKGRYKNFERLDLGLSSGTFNLPNKRNYDLSPHIEVAQKSVVEEGVQKMYASVGNGDDVDNIIMAGGPADIFKQPIQSAYPDHEIISLEDSQNANAEGFYLVGVEKAKGYIKQNQIKGVIL